ncbi:MAG: FAD-dependent oxidoreductase [Bdellovibrionales bacterium]|nr:FAD-dependent oxidoreductase [Bdellovibrionales bacterium]
MSEIQVKPTEKKKPIEYQCEVISNKHLTPTVFELKFRPHEAFDFKAGQFISVIVPGAGPGGRNLRRAYSIASEPGRDPIELCVKLVEGGPGTNYLHRLQPGQKFAGVAPYGDFLYVTPSKRYAAFISTGTGIAPFRSMMLSRDFREAPPKGVFSIFGVRDQSEILYEDEFRDYPGLRWTTCLSRPAPGWSGFTGRVTHSLEQAGEAFPWLETDFYLCGNGDMIKEIKALLLERRGVSKEAVHVEKYY